MIFVEQRKTISGSEKWKKKETKMFFSNKQQLCELFYFIFLQFLKMSFFGISTTETDR